MMERLSSLRLNWKTKLMKNSDINHLIKFLRMLIILMTVAWVSLTPPVQVIAGSLTMDFCRFRGDENETYLEIYIDLPRDEVTLSQDSMGWYGALNFNGQIRQNRKSIASDHWQIDFMDDNKPEVSSTQRVIDARIYQLPAGFYDITISARDSLSDNSWTTHDTITISDRPIDRLTISDIELASHMLPMHVRPIFSRGEFSLVPNPRRTFGGDQSFFIYYVEIYPPLINNSGEIDSMRIVPDLEMNTQISYRINRYILNGIQDTIRTYTEKIRTGSLEGFADLDTIDLEEFPTGAYRFILSVTDDDGNVADYNTPFYIYDKNRLPEHFKPAVNIKEVDEELAEVNFLLTRGQRKLIRKMNPEEKQEFLNEFWRRYDDNPATPEIPMRNAFRSRVMIADDMFNTSRSPGHKTDRGRIFILYGKPTDKEYYPLEIDSKPYEIWTYDHLEGGVFFAFVDRSGLGEHALVHSTKRGETYNPRWMELFVYRAGADSRR